MFDVQFLRTNATVNIMWQRRAKFLNERLENDYVSEQRGMIRAAFNLDNLPGGSVIVCLTHCHYPG